MSERSSRVWRWLLWVVALGLVVASLLRLAEVTGDQLAAPFDLIWESPGLRTIQLLQEGRDPYDPAVYAAPPFWISPYTPLYAQLIAALPADPDNPFATGRLVALCCLLLAAGSLLVVGGRAVPVALLALAAFFLLRPAVTGAAYLKCDSMALLLSVVTVLAVQRGAAGGRAWLVLGALAGSAALLTKQNFVAGSAAAGLWLLCVDRRRALTFMGLHAVFLAVPLAWLWSDGFRFSVFVSPQGTMTLERLTTTWLSMLTEPVFVLVVAWSLGAGVIALVRGGRSSLARAPFALYGVTSTLVLLATLGKAGSGRNYFIEPVLACLLALVDAARHRWGGAGRLAARGVLPASLVAAALLLAAAVVELGWEPATDTPARLTTPEESERQQAQLSFVADAIASLGVSDPLILNVFSTSLTYPLPGTVCVNDPYHYSLLYESGRLSTEPVVAALSAQEFDGVFVVADLLDKPAPTSPMGALHRALQRYYRVGLQLGPMDYLVPRQPRR